MIRDQVWAALSASVLEVFPEFTNLALNPGMSLQDLGANSIDRVEVIMLTLARLNSNIPLTKLAGAKNIADIMDTLCCAESL